MFDALTSMTDLMIGAPADERSADEYLEALTVAMRVAKQIRWVRLLCDDHSGGPGRVRESGWE